MSLYNYIMAYVYNQNITQDSTNIYILFSSFSHLSFPECLSQDYTEWGLCNLSSFHWNLLHGLITYFFTVQNQKKKKIQFLDVQHPESVDCFHILEKYISKIIYSKFFCGFQLTSVTLKSIVTGLYSKNAQFIFIYFKDCLSKCLDHFAFPPALSECSFYSTTFGAAGFSDWDHLTEAQCCFIIV